MTSHTLHTVQFKIDSLSEYCKKTLGERTDHLLRLRDKAIVSTLWIWFKRGHEVLSVKRKDVVLTENQILVTFHIQKKSKRFKICPSCNTKSGFKSKFCRECKTDLQEVKVQGEKDEFVVTKRKTIKNKFVRHIVNWIIEFDKLTEDISDIEEGWFYPPFRVRIPSSYFDFFFRKNNDRSES